MKSNKAPQPNKVVEGSPSEYDQERIPFDVVMRKLANTKPPHKAPKPAATPKPKKL